MARSARTTARTASPAAAPASSVKDYRHKQETAARPEAGAAPRFRAKKESATYRYDSSLAPAMEWDTAPARDTAAWLLAAIEEAAALPEQTFREPRELRGADGSVLLRVAGLQDALAALKRMQAPFLNWTGKAERLSFDVPALPLFVHERLSTEAIVKTLEGHRKRADQSDMFSLFADPQLPMRAQVNAYAHRSGWVNRMILGDSLSVMNSLARFEGLAGQVQCIYMDPPYGVKFGSNFQPFVRKRDVKNNDDADMTREPEMVQAYRDTWTLGLHSYLTYLRDRLMVARELLTPSGSIFVQISDDNLHHVRELMDEVFGAGNRCSIVSFHKTTSASADLLPTVADYLLWYCRDIERVRYRQIYLPRLGEGWVNYDYVRLADGTHRRMTLAERRDWSELPRGSAVYRRDNLTSPRPPGDFPVELDGRAFRPIRGYWKTGVDGMERLKRTGRLESYGMTLSYRRFATDFPCQALTNSWADTLSGGFVEQRLYAVQTQTKVVERCILMTTDPGDLVLDPTCGSGTTAYVAEQWGRRWITIDTSRVPLALARQRLLTATFPWHRLKDDALGPAGGFVYARRKNRKGEEVGGIVPHVTLKSIANNEPPAEEVLVDRPETDDGITRVCGPFVVEAVLPTPLPLDDAGAPAAPQDAPADHVARMIAVLRRSPTLALPGGGKVTLKSIRRPGRTLSLSAEAVVDHDAAGGVVPLGAAIEAAHEANTNALPFSAQPVAILFGPADGSVTARAVLDAAKEANVKGYAHLYAIGFGFTAEAQAEIDAGEDGLGLPASRVTMTIDVLMGDLLKTQRSSQIFAITGSPEIAVTRLPEAVEDGTPRWQVKLLGLDTFDPATMQARHVNGDDVPMWMLDTGWNGMAFKAEQVFFPRTSAWENLRKALKATHEESVWEHLRGASSAPFAAEAGTDIAVKVLDDRGNELLKIVRLERDDRRRNRRRSESRDNTNG
ncbi:MAG: site-specific DNA-methyltransferase [Acetobacteraceae bacterium]